MGEAERGEAAPRQAVTYFCSHEHRSVVTFAVDAVVPESWDCPKCGLPASLDSENPPPAPEDRALQDPPGLREGASLRRRGGQHPRRGDPAAPQPAQVGRHRLLIAQPARGTRARRPREQVERAHGRACEAVTACRDLGRDPLEPGDRPPARRSHDALRRGGRRARRDGQRHRLPAREGRRQRARPRHPPPAAHARLDHGDTRITRVGVGRGSRTCLWCAGPTSSGVSSRIGRAPDPDAVRRSRPGAAGGQLRDARQRELPRADGGRRGGLRPRARTAGHRGRRGPVPPVRPGR